MRMKNAKHGLKILGCAILFSIAMGNSVTAQTSRTGTMGILDDVGIDQALNAQLPLDVRLRDETGKDIVLRNYFGEKPVILAFVYYECPNLCTLTLNGLVRDLRAIPFDAGNQFNIVTISFDPRETPELAARKKQTYIAEYRRPGAAAGWHFLTGSQDAIETLTSAAGFHYKYDPDSQQWAHAAAIMVLTPQGRMARYFYGIEYSARDLRLSLVEAAGNRIGSPMDRVLLYCYHYDPRTARYGLVIMAVLRIAGVGTVLALAFFIVWMNRRDRTADRNYAH
jgi:protein SCO1/2